MKNFIYLLFTGILLFASCSYNEGEKTEKQVKTYSIKCVKEFVNSLNSDNEESVPCQQYKYGDSVISLYDLIKKEQKAIAKSDFEIGDSVQLITYGNGKFFDYSKVYAKYKGKDCVFFVNFKEVKDPNETKTKDKKGKKKNETKNAIKNTKGRARILDCVGILKEQDLKKCNLKSGDAITFAKTEQEKYAMEIVQQFIDYAVANNSVPSKLCTFDKDFAKAIKYDELEGQKITSAISSAINDGVIKKEDSYNFNNHTVTVETQNFKLCVQNKKINNSYGLLVIGTYFKNKGKIYYRAFLEEVISLVNGGKSDIDTSDRGNIKRINATVDKWYEYADLARRNYYNGEFVPPMVINFLESVFEVPFPLCGLDRE